jgi:hypothetical protein
MVLNPILLGGVWFIIHRYSVFHTFIWRGWVGGLSQNGHLCNVHSYNKCKDLDHLFIICGAVHASCISRNPFKALSIHVNHKTEGIC